MRTEHKNLPFISHGNCINILLLVILKMFPFTHYKLATYNILIFNIFFWW